ncbi:helix-turn-helix transcriptional regulator [Caldalkalibacillus salinus]|uniref:helix-turn-helix transcriptional regulator n=1 Tax=Caldalkalibacillus salinus TaxID=2803787 RepID=UPI001924D88B|nr:helix-turn-helix transcriptional regulator [Caldalkalibacillus salinus]
MIGQKIYYFRKSNGMTQEQLAHGICSVSHLSKIENGHETPSQDILGHLCNRLGITLDDIDMEKEEQAFDQLLQDWYRVIMKRNQQEMDRVYQLVKEKKKTIQSPPLLLKCELFFARYLMINDKHDEALSILKEIKEHLKHLDGEIKYLFYMFWGTVLYNKYNYAEAIQYHRKAEEVANNIRIEDPELYYMLGITFSQLYQISHSIYYTNKALELFNKQFDFKRSIECEIILGINSRRIENKEQAEKHYYNALKVAEENNDTQNIAIIYHNLGVAYSYEDINKSNDFYLKSTEYMDKENIDDLSRTYLCLAKNHLKLEDKEQALYYIDLGINILAKDSDHDMMLYQFKVLDFIARECYDEKFESLLKDEVIPFYLQKKIHFHVAEYAEMLAVYFYKKFKYKQASQYYRLANESRKNITLT